MSGGLIVLLMIGGALLFFLVQLIVTAATGKPIEVSSKNPSRMVAGDRLGEDAPSRTGVNPIAIDNAKLLDMSDI